MWQKNNKNKSYYNRKQPNFLEMIIEIFIALGFLLGNIIIKLTQKIFQKSSGIKGGSFMISNAPSIETDTREIDLSMVGNSTDKRYTLKQSLLSDAEKYFLDVLKSIVGDSYIIENQVQLSRIVTPLDSNKDFVNYHDFNQIKAKSIDFVLFKKDYSPYLCIELDDSSHLQWYRQKRDIFVDEIMKSVGLRIIHVRTSYSYNHDILRQQIFQTK
jgi:hypothetical protein